MKLIAITTLVGLASVHAQHHAPAPATFNANINGGIKSPTSSSNIDIIKGVAIIADEADDTARKLKLHDNDMIATIEAAMEELGLTTAATIDGGRRLSKSHKSNKSGKDVSPERKLLGLSFIVFGFLEIANILDQSVAISILTLIAAETSEGMNSVRKLMEGSTVLDKDDIKKNIQRIIKDGQHMMTGGMRRLQDEDEECIECDEEEEEEEEVTTTQATTQGTTTQATTIQGTTPVTTSASTTPQATTQATTSEATTTTSATTTTTSTTPPSEVVEDLGEAFVVTGALIVFTGSSDEEAVERLAEQEISEEAVSSVGDILNVFTCPSDIVTGSVPDGGNCCADSDCDDPCVGCFVMGRRRCATIAQDNINQVDCSTGNTCVINADCGAGESCGLFRLDNCSPATKVIGGTCLDL